MEPFTILSSGRCPFSLILLSHRVSQTKEGTFLDGKCVLLLLVFGKCVKNFADTTVSKLVLLNLKSVLTKAMAARKDCYKWIILVLLFPVLRTFSGLPSLSQFLEDVSSLPNIACFSCLQSRVLTTPTTQSQQPVTYSSPVADIFCLPWHY